MFKRTIPLFAAFTLAISPSVFPNYAYAQEDKPKTNQYWWPKMLDLSPLRQPNATSNPMGEQFNYAEEFNSLDLNAVIEDLKN